MLLNTRTTRAYVSRLAPLHGSDNPSTRARTDLRFHENQYAHPDAPKPIHPDKEQTCSSTIKLGANIQSTLTPTFAGTKPKMNRNSIFPVTTHRQAFTHQASNNLHQNGGDGRNRTDDPLLAKQVLYQLSYIPSLACRAAKQRSHQTNGGPGRT